MSRRSLFLVLAIIGLIPISITVLVFDIGEEVMAIFTVCGSIILLFYTYNTYLLRKNSDEQLNTIVAQERFNSFVKIFDRLSNIEEFRQRKAMYNEAAPRLAKAISLMIGKEHVLIENGEEILKFNPRAPEKEKTRILKDFQQGVNDAMKSGQLTSKGFHEFMDTFPTSCGLSALEVIEITLADMDIAFGPWASRNSYVEAFLVQWIPVFKTTSSVILPFVIIEGSLRRAQGKNDYRYDYLTFLENNGVIKSTDIDMPEKILRPWIMEKN